MTQVGSRFGDPGQARHMRGVQNLGWLFYIEDYTTHLYGDCNKPISIYNGMS